MPDIGLDVERILQTLTECEVRFIVIGGFAIELWDVAVPPTVDIDITPEDSQENLRRLAEALNHLDARFRVSGMEPIPMPGGLNEELLSQMSVLNLATKAGPLDVSMKPAGTEGYEDLARSAVQFQVGVVAVQVAALEDVARSKEAAGRAKDLKTLPAIRDHLSRRHR